MTAGAQALRRVELALRWSGRALFVLMALFWVWFIAGSFFYELQEGITGSRVHVFQVAVLVLSTVVVFTLELLGGLLLIALATGTYWLWGCRNIYVAMTMCLPLLAGGALLIAAWRVRRAARTAGRCA